MSPPPSDQPPEPEACSYDELARLLGIVRPPPARPAAGDENAASGPASGNSRDNSSDNSSGTASGNSRAADLLEAAFSFGKDGALSGVTPREARRAFPSEGTAGEGAPDTARTGELPASGGEPPPPAVAGPPPKRAILPPRLGALRPGGYAPPRDLPPAAKTYDPRAADMVSIPGGPFLFGEDATELVVPGFEIDRYPVTNGDYEAFVDATGHRPPAYWPTGRVPADLLDHPVVGVDYFDALAFARWAGKDLPFEDEWERAARGTDGRTYPWGNDASADGANTARASVRMTTPVDLYRTNLSPDGVRDLVGNAWEWTHSPASGGGAVVRGGSWYDFALYAKTWFRFAAAPSARNGTIGFRCVRRPVEREDEPREVDPIHHDGEIAARLGAQAGGSVGEPSADRRDLAPDMERLRRHLTDVRADTLFAPLVRSTKAGPTDDNPLRPAAIAARGEGSEPAPSPFAALDAGAAAVMPAKQAESAKPAAPTGPTAEPQPARQGAPPVVRAVVVPPARSSAGGAPVKPAAGVDVPLAQESRAAVPPQEVRPGTPTLGLGNPSAWAGTEPGVAPPRPPTRPAAEPARRPIGQQPMPLVLWLLLGVGFVLLGGLLVRMLGGPSETASIPDSDVAQAPPDEPEPDLPAASEGTNTPDGVPEVDVPRSPHDILTAPDYGRGMRDGESPRIVDGAAAASATLLDRGTWLLVFVDPSTDAGVRTIQKAHQAHRALVERAIEVALVMPRTPFEGLGGHLADVRALRERLRAHGIWDGMTVVFDGASVEAPDRGRLHAAYARAGRPISAAVVHNGARIARLAPLSKADALEIDLLQRLADSAEEARRE